MVSNPTWKDYHDFVIKIEDAGEGTYRAEAQGPTGEGETIFTLPFDAKDIEIFLLKVGRPRQSFSRGRVPEPMQDTVEFGGRLYEAVLSGPVRDLFVTAQRDAELGGFGLRLRLRLSDVPELADLPWEYLYDGRDFLALSDSTPLVRYLDLPDPPRPMSVDLPLRILVTISAPHDQQPIDVVEEEKKIRSALSGLIDQGRVELTFTPDATLQMLQHTLRRAKSTGEPFHAWHYIGHGEFDPAHQSSVLLFCDEDGMSYQVGGFQLGTLFNNFPETRLALLNACEGARSDREDPFAGVATALVERGVSAVIGMQFEISDQAAIAFSSEFYSALVDGLPIDASLTQARRAVFFLPNWVEWATPVLYMRSPSGELFDIDAESARPPVVTPPKVSEPEVVQPPSGSPDWRNRLGTIPLLGWMGLLTVLVIAAIIGVWQVSISPVPTALPTMPPQGASPPATSPATGSTQAASPLPPTEERRATAVAANITEVPAEVPLQMGRLLFQSNRTGLTILYEMNSDGSDVAPLASQQSNNLFPSISNDGRRVAFQSDRDGQPQIFVMNVDGSGVIKLTTTEESNSVPSWSPDGRQIAFHSQRDGNREVYVMNADGLSPVNLTNNPAEDFSPAWSPTGSQIAFVSSRDGNFEIYLMDTDGAGLFRLTQDIANDRNPAWSPDGSRLVFRSDRLGNNDIYVINADGTGLARLTFDPGSDVEPSWSPDGEFIVFNSNRAGNNEIYIMAADGSGQRRLTENSADDSSPTWFP